jgi:DNA-binding transcriptional ArsR family regulator
LRPLAWQADPLDDAVAWMQSGSPTSACAPFPMSLSAISRHLKVLERAGLILRRKGEDDE